MSQPHPRSLMPWLHRYATPLHILITLGLYVEMALLAGVASAPGVYAATLAWPATASWALPLRVFAGCCLAWAAYFSYTICVIFVAGAFRALTRAQSPIGTFSFYSPQAIRWARYNAIALLVRYTGVNFIRATPFLSLFHRMMGMKIGRRVLINTAIIADSNLIEIGDDTLIGGDATVVAHAAEDGRLVTAPIKIGSRVTIGLMSVIFPGVTIGDDAVVAACAVLPKGTRVGAGEIWAGVPARKIGEVSSRLSLQPFLPVRAPSPPGPGGGRIGLYGQA
jgi:acetyltransferase-like isoleucine patch superfamily enzyme